MGASFKVSPFTPGTFPPVGGVTPTGTFGVAPVTVVCTVTSTPDPGFALGQTKWDFGDASPPVFGNPINGSASHTYLIPGTFGITLKQVENQLVNGKVNSVTMTSAALIGIVNPVTPPSGGGSSGGSSPGTPESGQVSVSTLPQEPYQPGPVVSTTPKFPCANPPALCFDPSNPFMGVSSETVDSPTFIGVATGFGELPPLGSDFTQGPALAICESVVSQADADQCASRQLFATESILWNAGHFTNSAQTCVVTCPDGMPFAFTVAAGRFSGFTQAQADQVANSFACKQARGDQVCINTSANQLACSGSAYTFLITASSMHLPLTFTAVGALPSGATITQTGPATATVSGVAPGNGQYPFMIQVTDTKGDFMTKQFTLTVASINPTALPNAFCGKPYTGPALAVSALFPLTPTWSVVVGSLPTNLSMDPATGIISGTVPGLTSTNVDTLVPPVGTETKVFVNDATFIYPGETVVITGPGGLQATYLVVGPGTVQFKGTFLGAPGDSAPGTDIPIGSVVTPTPLTYNFTVQASSPELTCQLPMSLTLIPINFDLITWDVINAVNGSGTATVSASGHQFSLSENGIVDGAMEIFLHGYVDYTGPSFNGVLTITGLSYNHLPGDNAGASILVGPLVGWNPNTPLSPPTVTNPSPGTYIIPFTIPAGTTHIEFMGLFPGHLVAFAAGVFGHPISLAYSGSITTV